MRGKKTEDEQMTTALATLKDPYRLSELLTQTLEELADHVSARLRYTALDMIDQGRYFHAIKKLCGHKRWEDFVQERKWSWNYVRGCMKLTEVSAWLPELLHMQPGAVTKMLLEFPKPVIKDMLEDLSPAEISALTPWDLQRLHGKIPKRAARARKEITVEIPDYDQELNTLFLAAHQALLDIAEYGIAKKHKEQALKHVRDLSLDWERAAYNLSDPEHKTKPRWEMDPHERALDGIGEEDEAPL